MCLKRHWSSVCFWIFLVLLHFVASRHAQETLTLSDQNTEEENLKVKVKKSLKAKTDIKLQDVNSCDCRDYCPDPNSTELQRLVWIENHPLFCKESGRIDIDKEPYLAGCFFFCCRSCNAKYHECKQTLRREDYLKAAYDCVGTCLRESSLQITIKGW